MFRKKRYFFLIALCVTLLSGTLLFASAGEKETSETELIQQKNIRAFNEIDRQFRQREYKKTSKLLDGIDQLPDLNGIEKAYISNYRGNICAYKKDIECAISEFESVLEKKASISHSFYTQIVYVTAQLHFMHGDYSKTIGYAKHYLALQPDTIKDVNNLLAQAYFRSQSYDEALSSLLLSIRGLDESSQPIRHGLIVLLTNIYKELNQLEGALEFVDSMHEANPKTVHKLRIAKLYGELGETEKMESLQQELVDNGLAGYKNGELVVWNSEGDLLPTFRPAPAYPRKAILRKQEGWVDLMVDIDKSGKTKNVRFLESSRKKTFNKPAIESAKGYIFAPSITNGEPVEVKDYLLRISFELDSGKR